MGNPSTAYNRSHKSTRNRTQPDSSTRHKDDHSHFSALSFAGTSVPLRRYFSRRPSSKIYTKDLPYEKSEHGVYTPAGIFFATIKLTVPLAYLYIVLTLLSELCAKFPLTIRAPIEYYLPRLATLTDRIHTSSTPFLDSWAILEAVFYIFLIIKLQWLQYKCPLEASLNCAPLLELNERQVIWEKIMDCEKDDPTSFITGWFFDEKLENISRYDVRDFVTWSMFDGRNQEHLSGEEVKQLNLFMNELERRIGLQLFGAIDDDNDNRLNGLEEKVKTLNLDSPNLMNKRIEIEVRNQSNTNHHPSDNSTGSLSSSFSNESSKRSEPILSRKLPQPKESFRFHIPDNEAHPSFFSNLYENYKHINEQYRSLLENTEFHPVQGFRNFIHTQKEHAEKNAMATANQVYENASHLYENASNLYEQTYYNLIDRGGDVDKQISAISNATHQQLMDAWNSMREMKERLEMAKFISSKKKDLRKQLKGYQLLLDRTRDMSSSIPSKQMAELMRKITQVNDAMERIEHSARDAYVKATGYAQKNLHVRREPQRYAKYSFDPILGVSQYPLMFHLLILAITEGGLRVIMKKKGFERKVVGQISYYYHPGQKCKSSDNDVDNDEDFSDHSNDMGNFARKFYPMANNEEFSSTYSYDDDEEEDLGSPIVFVHGIGIGLLYYLALIDGLLKLNRPIFLPEIPYVTGFRTWLSPHSVLSPGAVGSTLTSMLATHGFLKAAFVGHSYGTSWLSYMCKYSPNAVQSVTFLDPICFCLHMPFLTKQFVYHRPDPGSVSNFVRTDVIINWTIQRSFPWCRISLFMEDIPVNKVSVFLSEFDALVPVERVKKYMHEKGATIMNNLAEETNEHKSKEGLTLTMFNGVGHGDWVESKNMIDTIVEVVDAMGSF